MLPPVHRGNGTNVAVPDVCNTYVGAATTPIPYVNTAEASQAIGFSNVVMVCSANACTIASTISQSSGDEAGTAHYSIKGTSQWVAGNPVVMIESKPAVTLSSPTSQNKGNAVGATTVPSVSQVLFTRRPGPEPSRLEALDPEGVTWCALPSFSLSAPGRLQLRLRDATAAIIDLRGNPGGRLDALTRALSLLLPRDTPLLSLVEEGRVTPLHSRRHPIFEGPLAVLVDGGTASAAELFAAVLQHHGRARIMGATTFGKSAALRLEGSGGRCWLPDGRDLEGQGVRPDVVLSADEAPAAALDWLMDGRMEGERDE